MPRYSRRLPPDAVRTALDPVRRADEREVAMLEGQLSALDRDIKSARTCLSRPLGGAASHRGHEVDAPHGMRDGRVRLTDGREIRIRPIEPCDAPELNACFQQLTAVSRYRRFLSGIDHLTAHQLQYLTTVDHADHEALVAVEAQSGAGIGVARYLRDANDPHLAELAVVVTDAWQGRGVGTALLERLVLRARSAGIERVVGRSIVGDHAAPALAAHVGDVVARRRRPGTVELTVQLRVADRPPHGGMIGSTERSAMRIEDVMTADVVTVTPETTLRDAAAELSRRRISGMPVVDDAGHVLGVISEADLLAKEQSEPDQHPGAIARLLKRDDKDEPSQFSATTVGESMTKPAVTVESHLPIAIAADQMLSLKVNRLPVVRQERLVGIVTRADLVRAFARSDEQIAGDARDMVALQQEQWRDSRPIDVTIDAGEVTLTGELRSSGEAAVLAKMVRTVPGVVNVRSALTWAEEDKPVAAETSGGASRARGFPPRS